MQQITLSDMLANEVKTNGLDEKLARLIETVAACGVEISSEVACGALMGRARMAGSENVQGEEQKNSTSSATTSSPRPCLSRALSPPVLRKKWITVWQPTVQIAAPISSATTRLTAQATSTSTSRSERSFRSCPIRTKTLPLRRRRLSAARRPSACRRLHHVRSANADGAHSRPRRGDVYA